MSCATGKVEFGSRRAARSALTSHGPNPMGRMHAYKCPDCPAWHIGHSNSMGGGARKDTPELRGYQRPRDVFTGFIVLGAHQVLFGSVCLELTPPPDDPATLTGLGLPDDLVEEIAALGDQRVVDTLLTAAPTQLAAINHGWKSHGPGGNR